MTINEKRDALQNFCRDNHCVTCPVAIENRNHKCGCGRSFTSSYPVSDEEVVRAYKAAFGENEINNSVNHPSHYNREGSMECIDEMVTIFGRKAVMNFCLCNVWKYRYRAADKNGVEDLKKSDWYMNKYKELISYEQAASV